MPSIPLETVERALRHSGGVMAAAAQQLGVTRQAVHYRVRRSKRLQQVVEDTREHTLDLCDAKLFELIREGNLGAIIWYQKTQGKHRGYTERQEVTGKDGEPLDYLERQRAADRELSDLERARKARDAAAA